MNKKIIGYTTGVFDLFHIGHLNILKNAKSKCDILIVGVTTDELVEKRKNKRRVIPFEERCEIIKSIKFVDKVVSQENMDKFEAWEKHKFDIMFVGSDWKGTETWNILEQEFAKRNVKVIFFPYTQTTSSTLIKQLIEKEIQRWKYEYC